VDDDAENLAEKTERVQLNRYIKQYDDGFPLIEISCREKENGGDGHPKIRLEGRASACAEYTKTTKFGKNLHQKYTKHRLSPPAGALIASEM
jgi:hypothetical protein